MIIRKQQKGGQSLLLGNLIWIHHGENMEKKRHVGVRGEYRLDTDLEAPPPRQMSFIMKTDTALTKGSTWKTPL